MEIPIFIKYDEWSLNPVSVKFLEVLIFALMVICADRQRNIIQTRWCSENKPLEHVSLGLAAIKT